LKKGRLLSDTPKAQVVSDQAKPTGPAAVHKAEAPAKQAVRDKASSEPEIVELAPMAPPAYMKRRHWGVLITLCLFVLVPLAVTGWYLWAVATDQYASTAGFTVRQDEGVAATDLVGGFAGQILSGGPGSDTDILYEFIQSQDLVRRVHQRIDLLEHYSVHWEEDPILSIRPDASLEDLVWFWGRIVRVSYDQSSGLIELRVLAFDPQTAQMIARAILDESYILINDLNATARVDSMRFAQADLDEAIAKLRRAREALIVFRIRTQIVDPETDLAGRLGVVNNLQGQLAQALIELDVLMENTAIEDDPRVSQATTRIKVIRERIAQERATVTSGTATINGQDYPTLLAEYESLLVDREVAEETYRVALTALDLARDSANRQSRYLAIYVSPTLAQTAEYPRRITILGLAALFLVLGWSILMLIYYSVRDSK